MKKVLFVLLALCATAANAQVKNWMGYLDTTILWVAGTDTIRYSKVYKATEGAASAVVVMANDTASAGFASDSTRLVYGYQVGCPVINGSGLIDTAWGMLDTLDTLCASGYGTNVGGGRYDIATDLITETWGKADTSMVTGYAYQIRPVRPYNWAPLYRVWINGITGTATTANKVVVGLQRMVGIPTVSK